MEPYLSGRPLGLYNPLKAISDILASTVPSREELKLIGLNLIHELPNMRPPREVLLGPPKEKPPKKEKAFEPKIKMEPGPKAKGAKKEKSMGSLKALFQRMMQANNMPRPILKTKEEDDDDEGGFFAPALPHYAGNPSLGWEKPKPA
jgi:hypothetical protein